MLFTPRVEALLQWFDLLYALEVSAAGWASYRRIALPHAGGVGDQPARLLEELAWYAQCRNRAIARALRAARATARPPRPRRG